MRLDYNAWRHSFAETSHKADNASTTLARILAFAKDRGVIATNPCEKGRASFTRPIKICGEQEIASQPAASLIERDFFKRPAYGHKEDSTRNVQLPTIG
jgi:hypothetical protein